MKHLVYFLCLAVLMFGAVKKARGTSLTLEWASSPSTNVVGYNVYYGTNSGNYPYKINAGNATSVTISNLTCGVTYYFVATSYDAYGDESAPSAQISFIVPGILRMARGATGTPQLIQFPVAPGHWYEIQATTDLQNWSSIWQSGVMASNVWMQFTDPAAGSYAARFYRLVAH